MNNDGGGERRVGQEASHKDWRHVSLSLIR